MKLTDHETMRNIAISHLNSGNLSPCVFIKDTSGSIQVLTTEFYTIEQKEEFVMLIARAVQYFQITELCFMSEAWMSSGGKYVQASQDPDRKEILLVNTQSYDKSLTKTYYINRSTPSVTLIEEGSFDDVSTGRFSNFFDPKIVERMTFTQKRKVDKLLRKLSKPFHPTFSE